MSELAQEIHRGVAASSIKRLAINEVLEATANKNLVSLVTGKRIAVLGLVYIVTGGTQTFQLRSGTGTILTGEIVVGSVLPVIWPPSLLPYVITDAGEPLNLAVTGGSNRQTGCLIYAEVN